MKKLAVIPARYASSRFEGKPLADICGKPMILHVYQAVQNSNLFDEVVVATDDDRIFSTVVNGGAKALMTSSELNNGTERVEQTLRILEEQNPKTYYDIVVNIQGDEPLIKQEMLKELLSGFENNDVDIATLKKVIENREEVLDSNVVKVVTAKDNKALYFSRCPIPFNRDESVESLIEKRMYYKHIGIYGYRNEVLKKIVALSQTDLERTEKLEQLRWLENGYNIVAMTTEHDTGGVDTKEDLQKVIDILNNR